MKSEPPQDVVDPHAVDIFHLLNPSRVFLSPSDSVSISNFSIIIDCIKLERSPLSKRTTNLELKPHPTEVAQCVVLSTAKSLVATKSVDVI